MCTFYIREYAIDYIHGRISNETKTNIAYNGDNHGDVAYKRLHGDNGKRGETTAASSIRLGDYVQMGEYNGTPILWRCVAFEKVTDGTIDSTQTSATYQDGYLPLMLADSAICQKAFDAAGEATTGSHGRNATGNFSRLEQGSNYWGDSNIRDWLNGTYATNSHTNASDWSCGNAPSYASEAGFLTNFSADEKSAIQSVEQKCIISKVDYNALAADKRYGNASYENGSSTSIANILSNYGNAFYEKLTDSVFLPDTQQVYNVMQNETALGSGYHNNRGDGHGYWLRTPGTTTWGAGAAAEYLYRSSYTISNGTYSNSAGVGNPWGVRPAFFLNTAASFPYGDGAKDTPYSFNAAPHKHDMSVECGNDNAVDFDHALTSENGKLCIDGEPV